MNLSKVNEMIEKLKEKRSSEISKVKDITDRSITGINLNYSANLTPLLTLKASLEAEEKKPLFNDGDIIMSPSVPDRVIMAIEEVFEGRQYTGILVREDGTMSQVSGDLVGDERLANLMEIDAATARFEARGCKQVRFITGAINAALKITKSRKEEEETKDSVETKFAFKAGDCLYNYENHVGCLLLQDVPVGFCANDFFDVHIVDFNSGGSGRKEVTLNTKAEFSEGDFKVDFTIKHSIIEAIKFEKDNPKLLFKKGDVIADSILGCGCILLEDAYSLGEVKAHTVSDSYSVELNTNYPLDEDDELADNETAMRIIDAVRLNIGK